MAGNIYTWSTTAATNATVDGDINFAEGQSPGSLNDSARALMAGAAGFVLDNNATITTSGSSNAYAATSSNTIAALATGLRFRFKFNFTNPAGGCTLNLTPAGGSAFGAKAIRVVNSSGADVDPYAGAIQNNGIYDLNYDAAANSAAGAFILLNPNPQALFTLLNTLTAATSSTLDDTTSITSAYDLYMISLLNIVPSNGTDAFICQYYVSSVLQTGSYLSQFGLDLTTGGILLGPNANANYSPVTTTAGAGLGGIVYLQSPNSTTTKKYMTGTTGWRTSSPGAAAISLHGFYNGSNGAVTGLRFKWGIGNITAGTIKIYGMQS